MLKQGLVVVAVILLSFARPVAAAATRMEARVYFSNIEEAMQRMGDRFGELDIVAVLATPPGENFLLIDTDRDQLREIQALGFRTEITYADLRDKFRKMTGFDPESDAGRNFGYFFTYYEMRDTIQKLAQNYPSIAVIDSSMMSFHNHPLYCLKMSDNPGTEEGEPQVFINGATHAREPLSTHTCVAFAAQLCQGYGSDSLVTWLVDNRETYLVPVMNPDGYTYNSDSGGSSSNWRKNRNNTSPRSGPGVDVNRNYGYKWGYDNYGSSPTPGSETYRGPSRFSEPETQVIRDFQAAHRFRTEMDFHTYGQYNLCSYGYANLYPNDSLFYKEACETLRTNNGYPRGSTGPIYRVLYTTNGGSTDWEGGDTLADSKFYTYAFSSELGINDFWYGASDSNYVKDEVALNVPNCFYLTRMAGTYLAPVSRVVNDTSSGNRNGQLDPAETANLWVTLYNRCIHPVDSARSVTAVLSSPDTMVQVVTGTANFPDMLRRTSADNRASQFQVHCSPFATPGSSVVLRLDVTYTDDGVSITQPLEIKLTIGSSPICDVGCTRIIVPTGEFDSTDLKAPACSVYNYAATASYWIGMRIGSRYNDSAQVSGHVPGTRAYVSFPAARNWPRGTLAVTCSTRLASDFDPTNDRQTSQVLVHVHDVGVSLIASPPALVDSGASVPVQAEVRNYGNVDETFNADMTIGTDYSAVLNPMLVAGGRETLSFAPNWSAARPRGSYNMACSTRLASDMNPGNNKATGSVAVQIHDVAARAIIAPSGVILPGSVAPQASVRNLGTVREAASVTFLINSIPPYANTVTLPAGLPLDADTVLVFGDWDATSGAYLARCSTYLASDAVTSNNVTDSAFAVALLDVGVQRIVSPAGSLDTTAVVAPQAVLKNFGTATTTFQTWFFVDSAGQRFYADAWSATLAAGDTVTHTFAEWLKPHPARDYVTRCSTWMAGDVNAANDLADSAFSIVLLDVGVVGIVSPAGDNDTSAAIVPQAVLKNFGSVPATFQTWFFVDSAGQRFYTDSYGVTLGAGETLTHTYAEWAKPHPARSYATRCSTALAGDVYPANDLADSAFTVSLAPTPEDSHPNVLPTTIIVPLGAYESSYVIAPTAAFANLGPLAATFVAIFQMDSGATHTVFYDEDSLITLASSDTIIVAFPEWAKPHPYGSYCVLCSVHCAQDTHHLDDTRRGTFDVLDCRPAEHWSRMTDLLPGVRSKNVKDGGALAYGRTEFQESGNQGTKGSSRALESSNPGVLESFSDTGYIYAFKGNNTCEFYRYNTLVNDWFPRESIPAYNRSSRKKAVKKGSSLAVVTDGKVYATKGNGTLDFWVYDPATLIWTQLTDVPAGAKTLKEGVGAAAVQVSGNDYIYLLKGSGTCEFYRYSTATGAWDVSLPTAPAGASGRPYKNGSAITFDGRDTIYCLKGSYNEFSAYSISGKTWQVRDPLPLIGLSGRKKKAKAGAGLAAATGAVFGLKGGNTNEFYQYITAGHKWYVQADMPTIQKRVNGGGALTYSRDDFRLYAFRGNNTREFWSYGPAGSDGVLFASPGQQKEVQGHSAFRIPHSALSVSPNPLTSSLSPFITYSLSASGNVSLKLYDITGKLVSTLVDGYRPAGNYSSQLTAHGSQLAAGVYLLELEACGLRLTSKLIVE